MADWYGTSRSNYVKFNPEKLDLLTQLFPILIAEKEGLSAIISQDQFGSTPSLYLDDDDDTFDALLLQLGVVYHDEDYIGLLEIVHLALEPGEILVWIEAGAEKARYITGMATAISHTGEVLKRISLNDIYEGLPASVTAAIY